MTNIQADRGAVMSPVLDPEWIPDTKTVQWVIDSIDKLVMDRINGRTRKKPLVSDERIAAVGHWIGNEYKRVKDANSIPADLVERCEAVSHRSADYPAIEQLFRDINDRTLHFGGHRNQLLRIIADKTHWGMTTTIDLFVEVTVSGLTIDQWAEKFHGG